MLTIVWSCAGHFRVRISTLIRFLYLLMLLLFSQMSL